MSRFVTLAVIFGLIGMGGLMGEPARAGNVKKPKLASEEEVAAALAQFKVDFKARGIPKEDVVSQRNFAMKKIAPLQHPDIVAVLAKLTKNSNRDLRTLALIYLGDQVLHPYLAAQPILAAMKRHKHDRGVLMTGLTSLCTLKYLGARKELSSLIAHRDFAVKKLAIATVGEIKDLRMLKEIMRLLGVDVDSKSSQVGSEQSSGGPQVGQGSDGSGAPATPEGGSGSEGGGESGGATETTDPGYSWDGVDIFVPEGEDPEQAVRDAQERNRSEAEAASRGGGGGGSAPAAALPTPAGPPAASATPNAPSSSSSSSSTPSRGKAGARSASELIPTILATLKKMTGKRFKQPEAMKMWVALNAKSIREKQRGLDKEEKAQKAAAKKAKKAKK